MRGVLTTFLIIVFEFTQVEDYCHPDRATAVNVPRHVLCGKLILANAYCVKMDLEKIRSISDACDLSGQDILDFIREERREKEKQDRDERAYQLEIRRQDKEILELQVNLEIRKSELTSEKFFANTSANAPSSRSHAKAPKLPPFDENKDDLDAYIQRFERYAKSQYWDQGEWAINLSALLKGKALDVYSRLAADDANTYETLKDALLKRFHLTAIGFQNKFRSARPDEGETAPQFVARLDNLFTRWADMDKTAKTYDGIKDLLLREQFLNSCKEELRLFLTERKPKNTSEMSKLAEQYSDAHGFLSVPTNVRKTARQPFDKKPEIKPLQARVPYVNRSKPFQSGQQRVSFPQNTYNQYPRSTEARTCYICHKSGHIARNCRSRPQNVAQVANIIASALSNFTGLSDAAQMPNSAPNAFENMSEPYVSGQPQKANQEFEKIACMMTPNVLKPCCSQNGIVDLKCGHKLPVMSAACGDKNPTGMPVTEGIINGNRIKVLRDSGCSGVVVKQDLVLAMQMTGEERHYVLIDRTVRKAPIAKIRVNTPYYTGECLALCLREPIYDLVIGNINGVRAPDDPDPNWFEESVKIHSHSSPEPRTDTISVNAVETRAQKLFCEKPVKKLLVPEQIPEIDKTQIKAEQQSDPYLAPIRKLANDKLEKRTRNGSRSVFFWTEGILYREFVAPGCNFGQPYKQLVVPSKFRSHVMKTAHETILGGHQGVKKTLDRILTSFFWPAIQSDVTRFCRSCDICQRTVHKGTVPKVPLGKMPLIDIPFQRVAVDLVGPIHPISEKGNRYILTLVDYATRYPEAIPLRNIDTASVGEALVDIFTRVGVPREILTDQGTQFTSDLMREISRLLSIRQLTTTPYHPSCNGLVERFNGTLKQMLKRLCAERPRDWDRYIGPLLFAYRDARHTSNGFSPFELLYGRTVRGPMSILKELWTGNKDENEEVRTTYQYVVDLRERIEDTCKIARDALCKSSERYKNLYDRKTKVRSFKTDDLVLLLLPNDHNKLLLQWKGPFRVVEPVGPVDIRIDLNGKMKVFHANMLKRYIPRTDITSTALTVDTIDSCDVFQQVCVSVIECEPETSEFESRETQFDNDDVLELPHLEAKETVDDIMISHLLSASQITETKRLLGNYRDVLTDLPGSTLLGCHDIKLTTEQPIRSKPYPMPYSLIDTVNQEVDNMIRMNIIERSESAYASPIVLVKKPDGTNRFCIDFRKLNRITIFDAEPIPNPEQIFSRLSKDHYFSKLDLTKGYWQVPMKPEAKDKTAFISPSGLYQFKTMPFGLINAPATFSRIMRKLIQDMQCVDNYIDDILVHTQSWETHMQTLSELLLRLKKAGLTAKPSKCSVGMDSIEYLGHVVGKSRLSPQQNKITKIQNAPRPVTKKQLRSFLGLSGYYRRFIPNYAAIAAPLTDKTRNSEPNKITWNESQQLAFEKLKHSLATSPILMLPDFDKVFTLRTDASDLGIGAILLQDHDEVSFPVAYASRKLLKRERVYACIEKECLALVWGVHKFQNYLYGKEFIVETDHQPLAYLQKAKVANARLMRWALGLQPYRIRIIAIKGSDNVGADFLSRNVEES